MTNYSIIENYINAIEPIAEGERNTSLFKIGIVLRTKFGLVGSALEAALSEVNRMKCVPPLPPDEIKRIVDGVDKANAPVGGASPNHSGQGVQSILISKQQTEYYVSLAEAIPVDNLLAKQVSVYPNSLAKVPSWEVTIKQVLESFRTCSNPNGIRMIGTIRNEPDKEKRNELKKQLPGFVFGSKPQAERKAILCKPNGILVLDFDSIPLNDLESAKLEIASKPYVFAVLLSVSGTGLFALIAYVGTPDLKKLLPAMQRDFRFTIDIACSDLCRMRYVTLDENLIIKDVVQPVILKEHSVAALPYPMGVPVGGGMASATLATPPTLHWGVASATLSTLSALPGGPATLATLSTETDEPIERRPFPVELLPQTIRDMVLGVQKTIGLKDCSTAAVAALTIVSGVIGASCKIRIKSGYLQPAHIFSAIIGKSGQAKSGTKEILFTPLREIQAELDLKRGVEVAAHKAKMAEWKALEKKDRPEAPIAPPPAKRFIISDITIEAVGLRLVENPFGLTLYNDELETFLGNMSRYNTGTDLPHWLSIHSGQSICIDRRGADTISIPNPSVAIIGGIQPSILRARLLKNPDYFDSGLLARFLLAMPPFEPILLNDNAISESVSEQWAWLVKTIIQQRESAMFGEKIAPHVFPIEHGAWEVLKEYQHRHAHTAAFANDHESALEGKFATNTARIALIMHIVNQIEAGADLSFHMSIPRETMEAACKIVEWFTDESIFIYSNLVEEKSPDEVVYGQILATLTRAGKAVTKRELKRRSRCLQRLDSEHKLDGFLFVLEHREKIQSRYRTGNGVPHGTVEYEICPVATVAAAIPFYEDDNNEAFTSSSTVAAAEPFHGADNNKVPTSGNGNTVNDDNIDYVGSGNGNSVCTKETIQFAVLTDEDDDDF